MRRRGDAMRPPLFQEADREIRYGQLEGVDLK